MPRPRINIENAVAMFAEYDSADEERRAAILLDGFTQTAPTTESRGRLVNGIKVLYGGVFPVDVARSLFRPPLLHSSTCEALLLHAGLPPEIRFEAARAVAEHSPERMERVLQSYSYPDEFYDDDDDEYERASGRAMFSGEELRSVVEYLLSERGGKFLPPLGAVMAAVHGRASKRAGEALLERLLAEDVSPEILRTLVLHVVPERAAQTLHLSSLKEMSCDDLAEALVAQAKRKTFGERIFSEMAIEALRRLKTAKGTKKDALDYAIIDNEELQYRVFLAALDVCPEEEFEGLAETACDIGAALSTMAFCLTGFDENFLRLVSALLRVAKIDPDDLAVDSLDEDKFDIGVFGFDTVVRILEIVGDILVEKTCEKQTVHAAKLVESGLGAFLEISKGRWPGRLPDDEEFEVSEGLREAFSGLAARVYDRNSESPEEMAEFAPFVFEELLDARGREFVVEKLLGMFGRAPDSAAAVAVLKNPALVAAILRGAPAGSILRERALAAAATLGGTREALVAADDVELEEFLSIHREVFGVAVPCAGDMNPEGLAEMLSLCVMRLEEGCVGENVLASISAFVGEKDLEEALVGLCSDERRTDDLLRKAGELVREAECEAVKGRLEER